MTNANVGLLCGWESGKKNELSDTTVGGMNAAFSIVTPVPGSSGATQGTYCLEWDRVNGSGSDKSTELWVQNDTWGVLSLLFRPKTDPAAGSVGAGVIGPDTGTVNGAILAWGASPVDNLLRLREMATGNVILGPTTAAPSILEIGGPFWYHIQIRWESPEAGTFHWYMRVYRWNSPTAGAWNLTDNLGPASGPVGQFNILRTGQVTGTAPLTGAYYLDNVSWHRSEGLWVPIAPNFVSDFPSASDTNSINWIRGDKVLITPYSVAFSPAVTLNEALDSTETGVDVNDTAGIAVGDVMLCESEMMTVTAIPTPGAPGTVTVTRGVGGVAGAYGSSTAGSHANGTACTNVVKLAEAIDTTELGWDVDSITPVAVGDLIRVDNEIVEVQSKAGSTLTMVARAANNSTAAAHSDNAIIYKTEDSTTLEFPYINTAAEADTPASTSYLFLDSSIIRSNVRQRYETTNGLVPGGSNVLGVCVRCRGVATTGMSAGFRITTDTGGLVDNTPADWVFSTPGASSFRNTSGDPITVTDIDDMDIWHLGTVLEGGAAQVSQLIRYVIYGTDTTEATLQRQTNIT